VQTHGKQITTIRTLLPAVAAAGALACQYYRRTDLLGACSKPDNTIVTEADRAVEALLRRAIGQQFGRVNIVGEEGEKHYDASLPYTFVLDPIDGTAVFANGAPGWAICVGLLDQALQPVAGIVSAPSWGSLFVADVDPCRAVQCNGSPLPPVGPSQTPVIDSQTTILVDSTLHHTHQVHAFPGKCRCFGSTALHICLVAQQSGFALAQAGAVHAWDIVAAHAIAQRVGLSVQCLDGRPLVYADMLPSGHTPTQILAAAPAMLAAIAPMFAERERRA
jgi:fructose-1,6-bisphosphatase/inositol monophosphatase family enzyme